MAHCKGTRKKKTPTKVRSYSFKGIPKKSPVKGHKCNCTTPTACKKAGKCKKHGGKPNARKKKK
jgi:hypothetical protein